MMQILENLYLLDFFERQTIKEVFPELVVKEVEEIDFAEKIFTLKLEEDIEMLLDIGIYLGDDDSIYIESHLYIIKDRIWIEEYDLVYLREYQKEAKVLVDFVNKSEKLLKKEIKDKNLPIKVYDTTKHKYKIAKNISETEKEEAMLYITDFEINERPFFKQEIEQMVREQNDKLNQLTLEDSKEAENLITRSLREYYYKKTDLALKERNEKDFIKFSELLNYYSKS